MLWRFCPFVGVWRFYMMMYIDLMTCIFWRCMLYIRCDCWEFYKCMLFEFWCVDVASISWIFILFACIIASIEIGCYTMYTESWWEINNWWINHKIMKIHKYEVGQYKPCASSSICASTNLIVHLCVKALLDNLLLQILST